MHVVEPRLSAAMRYLNPLVASLVIARCAWVFATPLRSHDLPLRMTQDDFYYYLLSAQNLAWHHHSTFFRNVATNGYHPLYLLVLTGVSFAVRTLPGIFRFLWLLDTVSAAAIFLLVRRLLSRIASPVLSNALAVLVTTLCVSLICDQMEVTLALPLGFAFLLSAFVFPAQITPYRAAGMGILAALLFLARLDAVLLPTLFFFGALAAREYRVALLRPAVLISFLAAAFPLPLLYLWSNHHFFGMLLPISGMAKELRRGWLPSILLPASFNGTSELLVDVSIISIVFSLALRRFLSTQEKILLFATLATSFVFYGLEMVLSDWQMWNWYFYVLRFAALGAAVVIAVLCRSPALFEAEPWLRSLTQNTAAFTVLLMLSLLRLYRSQYNIDAVMIEIQNAAEGLSTFAQRHPGVYAMGDRAGMFAVLSGQPVLQAEGLLMDRQYLEHIRHQDDLRTVLTGYGVNFYISFVPEKDYTVIAKQPCFHAVEPSIAGPSALRMSTEFCEPPVFQYKGSEGRYLIFSVKPL